MRTWQNFETPFAGGGGLGDKRDYLNISESVHCDNADAITEWGEGSKKQSQFPKNLQDSFIDGLFELIVWSIIEIYYVYQRHWASSEIRME